jgi:peptidylprolyl isomerase
MAVAILAPLLRAQAFIRHCHDDAILSEWFTCKRASAMRGTVQPSEDFGMPQTGNTLTLEITQGPVVIEMRPDLAPNHVAHIKRLASEKFYDGVAFHRQIEGFLAQTGCPHGTGTGRSKYPNLKAEFNAEPHARGTCSMARAQDKNSPIRNFLFVLPTRGFSTANIRFGGRSNRAWRMSTRSSAASLFAIPTE